MEATCRWRLTIGFYFGHPTLTGQPAEHFPLYHRKTANNVLLHFPSEGLHQHIYELTLSPAPAPQSDLVRCYLDNHIFYTSWLLPVFIVGEHQQQKTRDTYKAGSNTNIFFTGWSNETFYDDVLFWRGTNDDTYSSCGNKLAKRII